MNYRYDFICPTDNRPNDIIRYDTFCCALCQLSLNNFHTEEQIKDVIDSIKKETEEIWDSRNRGGGERAVFVICTMPNEKPLADKLEKLGFKLVNSFNRRNGYLEGYNDMWMINW